MKILWARVECTAFDPSKGFVSYSVMSDDGDVRAENFVVNLNPLEPLETIMARVEAACMERESVDHG